MNKKFLVGGLLALGITAAGVTGTAHASTSHEKPQVECWKYRDDGNLIDPLPVRNGMPVTDGSIKWVQRPDKSYPPVAVCEGN